MEKKDTPSPAINVRDLDVLVSLCNSQELRDYDWIAIGLYASIWSLLTTLWTSRPLDERQRGSDSDEGKLWQVWEFCWGSPEFNLHEARASVNEEVVALLVNRLLLVATSERPFLFAIHGMQHCLHWIYMHCVDLRATIRNVMGLKLLTNVTSVRGFGRDGGRSRYHVRPLLEVLYYIIGGFRAPLGIAQRGLLHRVLLPLHAPSEMVEWRDQIPVIQDYHEALVKCMMRMVQRDADILVSMISSLLSQWPSASDANTPKEVLLLHELEVLVSLALPHQLSQVLPQLLSRLAHSIGSDIDNIRPAQRTLQMFKNAHFMQLLRGQDRRDLQRSFEVLIPALYRGGNMSWNPTVNKMTGLALQEMRKLDSTLFVQYARELRQIETSAYGADMKKQRSLIPPACTPSSREAKLMPPLDSASASAMVIVSSGPGNANDYSPGQEILSTFEGDIKSFDASPSSLITGIGIPGSAMRKPAVPTFKNVGPESIPGGARARPVPMPHRGLSTVSASVGMNSAASVWRPGSGMAPPLGITGIAPWAMSKSVSSGVVSHRTPKLNTPQASISASASASSTSLLSSCSRNNDVKPDRKELELDGLELLENFINSCLPTSTLLPSEDWQQLQAAPTPTLLPTLRFHDLVFDWKTLGEGAFSTVKYARRIVRDRERSQWPEFAVKIVSAAKLRELEYHACVEREMGILQLLSHPGICRLVSAFRYNASAYMVLEYASRGDLHTYLLASGGLNQASARFILGEVSAAILSVHDLGFSYNDLKPENVLITELGHVKIADFGACRAITAEASSLLVESRSIVANLRNGDWKDEPQSDVVDNGAQAKIDGNAESLQSGPDDARWEGTPAYLPPEVLRGQAPPGLSADAWALGCLALFCLTGRPPFFGEREQVLQQVEERSLSRLPGGQCIIGSKVQFSSNSGDGGTKDADSSSFPHRNAFVNGLLHFDPRQRMTVRDAVAHAFLCKGDGDGEPSPSLDPCRLHMSMPAVVLPVLSSDRGGGCESGQWARRQFSVLWAPMPNSYSFDLDPDQAQGARMTKKFAAINDYVMTNIAETDVEERAAFSKNVDM